MHNTAAIIDADGSLLGLFRKMHIPDDPLFYEKFYFAPGDLGFRAWQTRYAKIGVLICWDQWYRSRPAHRAAQAQILLSDGDWLASKEKALVGREQHDGRRRSAGHAIANGCYVASVNHRGLETSGGR